MRLVFPANQNCVFCDRLVIDLGDDLESLKTYQNRLKLQRIRIHERTYAHLRSRTPSPVVQGLWVCLINSTDQAVGIGRINYGLSQRHLPGRQHQVLTNDSVQATGE